MTELILNNCFLLGIIAGVAVFFIVALYIYIGFERRKLINDHNRYLRNQEGKQRFKKTLPSLREAGMMNDTKNCLNEEILRNAVDKACNKVLSKKTRE